MVFNPQTDLKLVKSANTVSNIPSLGGAMTTTEVTNTMHDLWDMISDADLSSSVVGEYEYRCIYAKNASPTSDTVEDCFCWIEQNTVSPFTDIDIAIGTAPAGDDEQTVANENTPPTSVFWTFALDESEAQYIGGIPPGQGKSIWIRRHAGPARSGSSYQADNYILMFKFKSKPGPGGGPGPEPGPAPPAQGNDPFGLRMIYTTNTASDVSNPMYMNMNDPYSDCRFMTNFPATKNQDGSWSMGASTRIRLFTSGTSGCARDVIYNATLDTYDHDVWGERGYMYRPNDWKNVEITGYFKCITVDPNDLDRKLYLYSRGLRHNTTVGGGCSGTAYKGVIYGTDQELKWHKEQFHNGEQPCGDRSIISFKEGIPRTDNNQWFGMKVMMWNYPDPGTGIKKVHLELWLDINGNNTWIKEGERNDTGSWYAGMPNEDICPGDEYCGGHFDQIILWGGPSTEFRWDSGFTNVAFKWLSCREIIPGEVVVITPPPGPEPPPSPPPTGTDSFGTKNIYPSKSGGSSWSAIPWGNNNSRDILPDDDNCAADEDDSRLLLSNSVHNVAHIDGNGIMKVGQPPGEGSNSPRIRVMGTWRNVESTLYVRVPSAAAGNVYLDMRVKTDHYCMPDENNMFGGYFARISWIANHVHLRREEAHTIGYSEQRKVVENLGLTTNTWIGFKTICYNLANGNVKLEFYRDTTDGVGGGTWQKITEEIDDGTWGGDGGGPPIFTGSTQGSGTRNNLESVDSYIEYKKWTIREIVPPV